MCVGSLSKIAHIYKKKLTARSPDGQLRSTVRAVYSARFMFENGPENVSVVGWSLIVPTGAVCANETEAISKVATARALRVVIEMSFG